MNSFDNLHSDSTNFNARDEYEAREELRLSQTHDEDGNYIWDDEALAWEDGFDCDELYDYDDDDDGQPSEYEEWQDFYGGDDWDHGQYDEYY